MKWVLMNAALTIVASAMAQTPQERGYAIASEFARRDSGWGDVTAELTMILRTPRGRERSRTMTVQVLEVPGDGDKTKLVFRRPRDLEGTTLLTFTHLTRRDDQWLFMPSLRRVKRVAANRRSASFMGSEFAYEDVGSQELEKYEYGFVRADQIDGAEVLVVERTPVDDNSGYARQFVWYDASHYNIRRIDYEDRSGRPLKTLYLRGYRQYNDRFWRPDEMMMVNHQTGASTLLQWRNYRIGTGLDHEDFEPTRLEGTS